MKVKQLVDPLVQQAIKEAVEREGLIEWSQEPDPPLPNYKPIEIKMKPAPLRAFLLSILP